LNTYQVTLKVLSIAIVGISLIHITLGVSSETLLGSGISAASLTDPNLDSQNRFYGAAFALFAVVFWFCSTDLLRYEKLLKLSFCIFFLGGVSRLISILVVGLPSNEVVLLTAIEIIGPPGMYLWLYRITAQHTVDT